MQAVKTMLLGIAVILFGICLSLATTRALALIQFGMGVSDTMSLLSTIVIFVGFVLVLIGYMKR